MKICDFHVHSCFSDDSEASPEAIIEKAISLGIDKLCFTDHHDIDFPENEPCGMNYQLDTDTYIDTIKSCREKYSSKIDVRIGVELGLMDSIRNKARKYIEKYSDFDFIIGSSHLVHGADPYYPSFYEGRSEQSALYDYFDSILENVSMFDEYNVYGHLDYIVRYSPSGEKAFEFKNYRDVFEEIFKIIIRNGKGIEINTGSLYKGMSYAHPHQDILKLYREMGGEIITIGSDAHDPKYLCYGFEDYVRKTLISLGYKYFCTFKNKNPEFNPL